MRKRNAHLKSLHPACRMVFKSGGGGGGGGGGRGGRGGGLTSEQQSQADAIVQKSRNFVSKGAVQGGIHPERAEQIIKGGFDGIKEGATIYKQGGKSYTKGKKGTIIDQNGKVLTPNAAQRKNLLNAYALGRVINQSGLT